MQTKKGGKSSTSNTIYGNVSPRPGNRLDKFVEAKTTAHKKTGRPFTGTTGRIIHLQEMSARKYGA